MKAGLIDVYLHSDKTTKNKGGALVKVICDSDFGAKTPQFEFFVKTTALTAYATDSEEWSEMVKLFPNIERLRVKTSEELHENVTVEEIRLLKL